MTITFFQTKYDILLKEWEYLENKILKFDSIVFSIRGWAVSVYSACLIFAAKDNEPAIMILCIIPLLVFWATDALQKAFQRKFITRKQTIEDYLNSKKFEDDFTNLNWSFTTPLIGESIGNGTFSKRLSELLKAAKLRNVLFTYISLIIACLLTFTYFTCYS